MLFRSRDFSPSNILVGYDGSVKIIDFGIAKADVDRERTQLGVIKGKVRKIASDSLPPDHLKNFYRVPVDIALESQTLKLKDGTTLPLQVGMSITANVKLRKVTYLQLLLSDFKNKADALRRI